MKEWFKEKIEQAKELINRLKENVSKKIRSKKHWVLKADVYDSKGKKILAKDTSENQIIKVINSIVNAVGNLCSSIITLCKRALGMREPKGFKEKINAEFNKVKSNVSLIKKIFALAEKKAEFKANMKANAKIREMKSDLRSREREVTRRERRVNYYRGKM